MSKKVIVSFLVPFVMFQAFAYAKKCDTTKAEVDKIKKIRSDYGNCKEVANSYFYDEDIALARLKCFSEYHKVLGLGYSECALAASEYFYDEDIATAKKYCFDATKNK